jgi:DNA repair exonuclease SbcCD nuclease subunit
LTTDIYSIKLSCRRLTLFKKAAVFTDLHLGLKSNSKIHNLDCEEFVDWFIHTAKSQNCETGIFCGDWNHSRSTISLTTLDTGIKLLEKLGKSFENFYMFAGNHDLYYKDRRDIKSIEFAKHISGITIINDILVKDKVALVPWLVGDEWKKISKIRAPYMFGHFELPSFYMNAMVQMPDHGELNVEHFQHQELVFSGHFHKRQQQGKIHYIGNAFPHNYADTWDDQRGMMTFDLQNNGTVEYFNWDQCPKYRTLPLSDLIDRHQELIKPKMYLRVALDVDISYEEATMVRETFLEQYQCREIKLIPQTQIEDMDSELDISQFESVDQIVSNEIMAIDSENYDKKILLEIYRDL